ncbi:hypothetical protein [Streptomyces xanthophaeus]|uniref:hypothetical protein n=1 Tax=Streptomyces xanthophaeus TaxID=67385 RepID=UPI0012FE9E73|nr:hypothetical protein [Streptomyces xanthophaeus]
MTEFSVQIAVHVAWVGKQKHLELEGIPDDPACHIYVIGKRQKLSIHPNSVQFESGSFRVVIRRQTGEDYEEIAIRGAIQDKRTEGVDQQYAWHSEYPYEEFRVVDAASGALIFGGEVAAFFQDANFLPAEWRAINIVYVGQSLGRKVERQALDRLVSHSTLQRVYSESSPDEDVWLGLCTIIDTALHFTIDPKAEVSTSDEEDDLHIQRVHEAMGSSSTFQKKAATALAEGALISYFDPKYNVLLRGTFPDAKHSILAECYELEFQSLMLEFNALEQGIPFASAARRAATCHYMQLPMHPQDGGVVYVEELGADFFEQMTRHYEL